MPNSLSISDRIRELRKEKKQNQKVFAETIGVKENNVAQWEAGNNGPSLEILRKIMESYNVTADWLLFGISQEQKKDAPESTPLNEIVNVLKELAGSAKGIESSLRILSGYSGSTLSQSHSSDISAQKSTPVAQAGAKAANRLTKGAKAIQQTKRGMEDSQDQA